MDELIRGIDEKNNFRFFIEDTTESVRELRRIHKTSPTATAALGRLSSMAFMIGADLKNDGDAVTLKIKGDGPAGLLLAVCDSKGNVRATMDHPEADVPPKSPTKLDVGGLVGHTGSMSVIRDYGLREPWTGIANLVSGEIAEDFANYFAISEQQPSVVSLGVLIDINREVEASGGIMIQPLPYTEDIYIDMMERAVEKLPPVSQLIKAGLSPEDILRDYFSEFKPQITERRRLNYKCNCSKEKIEKALISLGRKELLSMAEEDQGAEVQCHFCNRVYNYSEKDLKEMALRAGDRELDWKAGRVK